MADQPTAKNVLGEELIFRMHPSFFILLGQLLPMIIAVAGLMFIFNFVGFGGTWINVAVGVVAAAVAVVIFLNWVTTVYQITNKKVESHAGIIGIQEQSIPLHEVQDVGFTRSIVGTIFNFGTVSIKAAGEQREVIFVNISNPKKMADRIEDLSLESKRGRQKASASSGGTQ